MTTSTKTTSTKTTKTQLVARVAEQAETSPTTVERVLTALTESIAADLETGTSVTIPGLGTFEARDRAARGGRNPRTGEPVQIAATRVPAFKAAAGLRRRVAGA
jgi:DNA-binding protein HU-beta